MKNILIIQSHPNALSLCDGLATAYETGALAAQHTVRRINLRDLRFDPILQHGYRSEQTLEPDLAQAQHDIRWADHLVFVYPNWWGSMPALLKGFFDRTLLPGFAFKYRPNSSLWDKLLVGKTAELLVTMDTPGWYYRWVWKRPGHNQMKHTILGYCGVKVTGIHEFAPVHGSTPETRNQWLAKAKAIGQRK